MTPPTEFGPHGLLQYDARFGVLICRECQYAIQKSAMESHLLKHKIYRDDRQQLLSFISGLDLKEPEQVFFPPAASPPVAGLPVIPGFRCQVAGCDNLCASQKRMKRHQSEEHNLNDNTSFSTLARPAKLQTFFRGTKLKYFEVSRLTPQSSQEIPFINPPHNGVTTAPPVQNAPVTTQQQPQQSQTQPQMSVAQSPSQPPPSSINLAAITYFHHFTTITSLTLPQSGSSMASASYWQIDAVSHALREHWLMCGLLAISAYHYSVFADSVANRRSHSEQSELFSVEFFAGYMDSSARNSVAMHETPCEAEARTTSERIRCILNLVEWTSIGSAGAAIPSSYQLQSFMTHVRSFVSPGSIFFPNASECEQDSAFKAASEALKSRPADRFSAALSHLEILPTRLAEVLPRTENIPNVMAILRSIAVMVSSCAENFATDEAEVCFMTMSAWLAKLPDRFHQMLADNEPAALIVTACWAAILVKRAEHCGCWFLGNSSEMILAHVMHQVSDNYKAVRLIEELQGL